MKISKFLFETLCSVVNKPVTEYNGDHFWHGAVWYTCKNRCVCPRNKNL